MEFLTFAYISSWCSIICWKSVFLSWVHLHFTKTNEVYCVYFFGSLCRILLVLLVHSLSFLFFFWDIFAMQCSLSLNSLFSYLNLLGARTTCMYNGTWWCQDICLSYFLMSYNVWWSWKYWFILFYGSSPKFLCCLNSCAMNLGKFCLCISYIWLVFLQKLYCLSVFLKN